MADTVFVVRRNADWTEGRGPMIVHSIWATYELAADFIDQQSGVQGIRRKWSEEKYGDWEIEEMIVKKLPYDPFVEVRQKALSKLTTEERRILGLD